MTVGRGGAWGGVGWCPVSVGAIDGTVRGPLFLIAQTSLCAVFAAISAKTRQNLAVGGLCGLSCFRPSFRIVLADVCGPECRQTSLRAVFAKIAFSPTRNTKSNTKNRPLSNDMLYCILLQNTCSRLRETLLWITLHCLFDVFDYPDFVRHVCVSPNTKAVNVAARDVCLEIGSKSVFRPSFRIVLADV